MCTKPCVKYSQKRSRSLSLWAVTSTGTAFPAGWLWTALPGGTPWLILGSPVIWWRCCPRSPMRFSAAWSSTPLCLYCEWYKKVAWFKVGILCSLPVFSVCSQCTHFSDCSGDVWGCICIWACSIPHQHLPWFPQMDIATIRALPIWPGQPW